ncbi:MAG: Carboxymethylenebutenolidase [Alphaproteobacteria bacterium MarineAlpha2_Bin1]|nr:MAG: Carboxymethylenebutenolidase [Alphaproteobacteria bacterium MarineAlpha2_Bin1]
MEIKIETENESFSCYKALPENGKGPVIVCLQEIFGVNLWMRNIADKMSSLGFVAIVPDLFWRIEPNVQINGESEEDFAKAFDLYGKFNTDLALSDIEKTVQTAKNLSENDTGKVGTMGFCLGGFLSYLSSIHTSADANVGYYGVGIENKLNEKSNIKSNLILHIATEDQFVPLDIQETIHKELDDHPRVSIYDYKADHAFSRIGGESYVEEIAKEAEERTINFFNKFLR